MKDNKIQNLKKEYMEVDIPGELDFVAKKALKEGKKDLNKKQYKKKIFAIVTTAAVSTVILTVAINTSPVFANTLSKVPVINSIVKVLTIDEHIINKNGYNADIKTPVIEGLENEDLQNNLNEKYIEENQKLYQKFIAEMQGLKENGGGNLRVDSGYEIKTDTERILSIGRYVVNTVGSSSTTFKYDTIDKEKEILISLPSLFKNDSYIEAISNNIKEQMREEMKVDEHIQYWIDEDIEALNFNRIDENQSFYINSEYKLVISFDKYDVAPGYMGMIEFVIPTEVLSNILVSGEYIK